MPTVAFASGTTANFSTVVNLVDLMSFSATPTALPTSTTLLLAAGPYSFSVSGVNLGYTTIGSDTYLSSGTINSILIQRLGSPFLSVTNLGLDAAVLFNALVAEVTGANSGALENMLIGLSYDYTGLAGADIHLASAISGDGVSLNLRGNDRVNLLGGNDRFFLGDGNDTAFGGNGKDWLGGGTGNDSLNGGIGNDTVEGDAGNDTLFGQAGNDSLLGGIGNDLIRGGADEDRLNGGAGRDLLWGELGDDRFIFSNHTDIGLGANRDRIMDFISGSDEIDLTALGLTLRGTRGFSGTAPEARLTNDGVNGYVHIDIDGNKTVDATLMLTGVTVLAAGDILV